MTKKTKTCIISIIIVTMLIGSLLASLLITKSYCIPINRPDSIVVYYNKSSDNIVLNKNSSSYNKIYKQLTQSHQQPILMAFVENSLNKEPKIVEHEVRMVDYSGISIEFVYDSPQVIKTNGKIYKVNGDVYWYQSIVFNISKTDNFKYNTVAVIPPYDSNNYISPLHHTVSCKIYSNYSKLYKTSISLFK